MKRKSPTQEHFAPLSKELPVPLYHQLKTILLEKIRGGDFRPGDRLPAEDELAAHYSISKATVRQALNELAAAGALRREQGRGTFVAEPKLTQGPHALTSFSEDMRKRGLSPASKVLIQGVVRAEADVAEKLRIERGSPAVRIRRLRMADGQPMGIQTAYLPLELVPRLAEENLAALSLYEVLESKYGLRATRAEETHFAVLLEPGDAKLLKVAANSPALAAERVAYLASGRPLELTYSMMRGDRYRIVLELTRCPGL